ncbi:MAG TPA: PadR family transcriptional regulator [Steroidobacteraceae bacterium]|jgi:DNA-binding PadR family transcriptional regulator|nr:PadR family transcriptional regulator [Steroidobacteraceae bacterium]
MHHRHHLFFARHQAGRRFGHFGKGFLDGGGGGRAFGMGRKLASVDLQLLILGLLEEKPRHGYEIIKALDERSKGFYVPSPGMVYPSLTYLEEIGHATVEAVGARKLYHITDAGKEHLDGNRGTADALFAQFGRVGERMDRVRRAMRTEETGERDSEEPREHERRGSKELQRARRELKAALLDKWDSSREEQRRIAEILQRAAAEILGH